MATTTRQSRAELFEREASELGDDRQYDVVDELYVPEFESGTTRAGAGTGTLGDREAIRSLDAEWHGAFPDVEIEVTTVLDDGDTVLVAREMRGIHEGTFRGIEPTGRAIDVRGFSYRRASDGRHETPRGSPSSCTQVETVHKRLLGSGRKRPNAPFGTATRCPLTRPPRTGVRSTPGRRTRF